jgi:sulfoxide reductase heme-binding subunit YedZ
MDQTKKQFDWVRRILKPLVFVAALVPIGLLAYRFLNDQLSANPLDDITDETGTWTIRFIVATLAVTPLKRLTNWSRLSTFRRMLGNFAFFYGSLHFFTYLYFDKFFEWPEILADIPKRRFILVGFSTWLSMLPLALTSTNRITKWMGGKRWKRLHRLMYVVGVFAVVHYMWLVKSDITRPSIYGAIVAFTFGVRIFYWVKPKLVAKRASVSNSSSGATVTK